jgi:hypothetical protein
MEKTDLYVKKPAYRCSVHCSSLFDPSLTRSTLASPPPPLLRLDVKTAAAQAQYYGFGNSSQGNPNTALLCVKMFDNPTLGSVAAYTSFADGYGGSIPMSASPGAGMVGAGYGYSQGWYAHHEVSAHACYIGTAHLRTHRCIHFHLLTTPLLGLISRLLPTLFISSPRLRAAIGTGLDMKPCATSGRRW